MASRLVALAPRLFVTAIVAAVLASATITFAAVQGKPLAPVVKPAAKKPLETKRVPDVTGQAYVFAKGTLEEAGFAWNVVGAGGYAVNRVSAQSPAAGVLVVDTGAPTVVLTLGRNSAYPELGTPENGSPYIGTAVVLPGQKARVRRKKPRPAPVVAPTARPKERAGRASFGGGKVKLTPASRPPAFEVAGAPSEPLDEMPLPDRARALDAWLSKHRQKTDANVKHWSYQHAWIVYGASFGWWRGAEALEILVAVDRRVRSLWGIGSESETVARNALAEVRQRSR